MPHPVLGSCDLSSEDKIQKQEVAVLHPLPSREATLMNVFKAQQELGVKG